MIGKAAIFIMNLPNMKGSRKKKRNPNFLISNCWVDFSFADHCGSKAYTCGNIDLSQSSAITVKRCWHIHHPLSKRLIQSPERLGIGWSDVISPLLYAAMVTLLAKPGSRAFINNVWQIIIFHEGDVIPINPNCFELLHC